MKELVLKYGAIAGLIVSVIMLISFSGAVDIEKYGYLTGYGSMIIAFTTIYFAVRSYRDSALEGSISFLTGLKIGLGITLVATLFYVVSWMILSNTIASDFMSDYYQQSVEKLQASDLSQEEITEKIAEMDKFQEMYKNPIVKIGFTFLEIFPVGFIISLVSAFFLKKK